MRQIAFQTPLNQLPLTSYANRVLGALVVETEDLIEIVFPADWFGETNKKGLERFANFFRSILTPTRGEVKPLLVKKVNVPLYELFLEGQKPNKHFKRFNVPHYLSYEMPTQKTK